MRVALPETFILSISHHRSAYIFPKSVLLSTVCCVQRLAVRRSQIRNFEHDLSNLMTFRKRGNIGDLRPQSILFAQILTFTYFFSLRKMAHNAPIEICIKKNVYKDDF